MEIRRCSFWVCGGEFTWVPVEGMRWWHLRVELSRWKILPSTRVQSLIDYPIFLPDEGKTNTSFHLPHYKGMLISPYYLTHHIDLIHILFDRQKKKNSFITSIKNKISTIKINKCIEKVLKSLQYSRYLQIHNLPLRLNFLVKPKNNNDKGKNS